jgi:hypothetical protein
MVLVFLYGPPAVGKLTVATALAARTGFRNFHGHLTFDLACALFEPFTRPFGALVTELRLKAIEVSARHGLEGMIFTYCYAYPEDNPFIERVQAIVEDAGGEIKFVHLTCEVEELERRVVAEDRRAYHKLGNVPGLRETLQRWELYTPIPGVDTLSIDNTQLSPEQVVERIVDHFRWGG